MEEKRAAPAVADTVERAGFNFPTPEPPPGRALETYRETWPRGGLVTVGKPIAGAFRKRFAWQRPGNPRLTQIFRFSRNKILIAKVHFIKPVPHPVLNYDLKLPNAISAFILKL